MKYLFCILAVTMLIACNNPTDAVSDTSTDATATPVSATEGTEPATHSIYPDDTYCAAITDIHLATGKRAAYTLTIVVQGQKLALLQLPNQEPLYNIPLDDTGTASITNKGHVYDIVIIGKSDDCPGNGSVDGVPCRGHNEDGSACTNMTDVTNRLCWMHQDQQ